MSIIWRFSPAPPSINLSDSLTVLLCLGNFMTELAGLHFPGDTGELLSSSNSGLVVNRAYLCFKFCCSSGFGIDIRVFVFDYGSTLSVVFVLMAINVL